MGKTSTEAKVIAKKSKYGRLQKLKWYCEICQHQCNDEQSYRQHVQSEKHRLLMTHFRASSGTILNNNSRMFESAFMDVLRNRFRNREVPANVVYTQVIRDKNHVHMNSTHWESLRGFVSHLERTGKVRLRMAERGPMIKYIDHDDEIRMAQMEDSERSRRSEVEAEAAIVHMMLESQPEIDRKEQSLVEAQPVDIIIKCELKPRRTCAIFGGQ